MIEVMEVADLSGNNVGEVNRLGMFSEGAHTKGIRSKPFLIMKNLVNYVQFVFKE